MRNTIPAIILFLAATIAAYAPAFDAGYNFDDKPLIERNQYIRSLKNVPLFFVSKEARVPWTHGGLQNDIYRPIQSASLALSYSLWGDRPGAFHKENVLLHFINGVLVYLLLILLLGNRAVAILAALLFLVHPVQVEAVTYLVERASVLSLSFFLIAFCAFILSERKPRRFNRYAAISLVSFLLSIFTKETAVILPVILVLYLMCFRTRNVPPVKTIAAKTWWYFAGAVLFVVLRTVNLGQVAQYETISLWKRLLVMSEVFWDYLRLLVFPATLTFFPQVNSNPFQLKIAYLFFAAVVAAFIALAVFLYKRRRRAAFFLLAYLVALLPVSNIIPIKTYMQERFLYYPSVFILSLASLSIVGAVHWLGEKRGAAFKCAVIAAAGVAVIALTTRTHMRNRDWRDQETLMLKEATVNPENVRIFYDLAVTTFKEGDYDTSRDYCERALKLTHNGFYLVQIYDQLGTLDKIAKRYDRALENYHAAVRSDPSYPYPYNSMGMIYVEEGNIQEAISNFEKAVERNPSDYVFNKNLGSAYNLDGKREQALRYWKKSLEINPDQPDLKRRLLELQNSRGG
jgi:tetratricopeptide (TPR) repeat protein